MLVISFPGFSYISEHIRWMVYSCKEIRENKQKNDFSKFLATYLTINRDFNRMFKPVSIFRCASSGNRYYIHHCWQEQVTLIACDLISCGTIFVGIRGTLPREEGKQPVVNNTVQVLTQKFITGRKYLELNTVDRTLWTECCLYLFQQNSEYKWANYEIVMCYF